MANRYSPISTLRRIHPRALLIFAAESSLFKTSSKFSSITLVSSFEIWLLIIFFLPFFISLSTRKYYKRLTPFWVSLDLPLPPPQSCSSPLQYCLASVVSLHVLSSDVVGESSNSETLFRKTNKPLMDWKLMEVAYWPRVVHFLLISIEISTIRTRTNSFRKFFPCRASF